MQGVIEINIGGAKRTLRFNNYSHFELSKQLFQAGHLSVTTNDVLDRLHEMASENVMLLMKALIYSGIIGNDYEVGFTKTVTIQEVGKWVAEVNESELVGIWDTFLDAMGVNIENPEKKESQESDPESEKKN